MTREKIRMEFERSCQLPQVLEQVKFPLGAMTVNDEFSHYMDSDTDSAWMGYLLGFRRAEQLMRESDSVRFT